MIRVRTSLPLTLAACSGLLLAFAGGRAAGGLATPRFSQEAPTSDSTSFAEDVLPIFKASCVQCHGGEVDGEVVKEVSLDLTTYEGVMAGSEFGEVVEGGNPDESMLFVIVEAGDMPQEGDPLPAEQIETIRRWIAEGAPNN